MDQNIALRDGFLALCHFLNADRRDDMLHQACRVFLAAARGQLACLFLTDVTGHHVELAAACRQGDSHWGHGGLRLNVGSDAGSMCPLAQVAQTGRMLHLTGAGGYDFSRLSGLCDMPSVGHGLLVIPLRPQKTASLFGIVLVQTAGFVPEGEMPLRLLADAVTGSLTHRLQLDHYRQDSRFLQDRLKQYDLERRLAQDRRSAGLAGRFAGSSALIRKTRSRLAQLATHHEPVLILGEDGTGKERAARAVHELSKQPDGAFVYVDCASLPLASFMGELCGYKRGAVAGLASARRGLLREAAGGVLYIDRLELAPFEMQLFFARLLELKNFRPLGSERDLALEARLIFAARPRLQEQVEKGQFLSGLLIALMRHMVHIPALHERREDIDAIITACANRAATLEGEAITLSPLALSLLQTMDYPQNLRQLEGILTTVFAQLEEGQPVRVSHIEMAMGKTHPDSAGQTDGLREAVARFEAGLIRRALHDSAGDRAKAAGLLHLPKRTLADKCLKYAL